MEATSTFLVLLAELQCVFTAPTFVTFLRLMCGWVLSHRRSFVTDLIWSSGITRRGHHSKYHRFFSKSVWELDTLCRKRGLAVYGTGMHHDPLISSRAKPLVSWVHDWVVLSLIVRCPFWASSKVWRLPLAFRLCRNRQG